ncbi:MAG: hypothetical protein GWN99_17940 [Gemmatimonadetes bacterium]|uniref:Uncharacterized protein n=1 Tax=Candidatus Kutchimonas denitrificans TaxID=3056748 RepID=A0AAE5C9L6_9BACT|nr:hypothetical protein [Gemmatimonadota bacterium]NIR75616.1 hypothetical protein [Candidatus Kutchimonas denitrificans]NIS02917.1 hypothetical protein [Gemmatimonadota bacterium]NIT68639.1 hypothetical protein [Gemmatimonadota bacterium]NIV25318.1 hypothetical protein [Gemmatimonadota bacterium]
MIQRVASGEWSVSEFDRSYYDYFLDEAAPESLTGRELEFFGAVQEKLDWVDESPDSESRSYGWMDHQEFREWVKEELARFLQ